METIIDFITNNAVGIIVMLTTFIIIIFIMSIVAIVKANKLKSMYNDLLGGSNKINIEQMLLEHHSYIKSIDDKYSTVQNDIRHLNEKTAFCIQKIGMVRYNPFENVGGNLCYALALLNDHNNGVIINTIYSRDGSYNYGKPIQNGECEIPLSDEEKEALRIALQRR